MAAVEKRLLFFISSAHYFFSHRLCLAKAAQREGFRVAIATTCKNEEEVERLRNENITLFPLRFFQKDSMGLWQQGRLIHELHTIYGTYRPHIVHHVAMKSVLMGSLIAKMHGIPCIINAFGGLGYIFTGNDLKRRLLRTGMLHATKYLFRGPHVGLILQNLDDQKMLVSSKVVRPDQIHLVRGVGVDLDTYVAPPPPPADPLVITCVSRTLWDKGIRELVEAARLLRTWGCPPIRILLVGGQDTGNPTSISTEQLESWKDQIEWVGHQDDVLPYYEKSHIVVLPSYREGLPKALVEAASCSRPIVATDVPGCREVVVHDYNGLLVPPKDPVALARALMTLIKDPSMRLRMGQAGRTHTKRYFCEKEICQKMVSVYAGYWKKMALARRDQERRR